MRAWLIEAVEGRVHLSDVQKASFHDFALANPKVKYRLAPIETKRSGIQNNLYWAFLEKIERETGNNASDLHELAKRKFLKPKFIKVMGQEVKIPGSTKDLGKVEFGEYLDKISAWTEIAIPSAEEAGYFTQ